MLSIKQRNKSRVENTICSNLSSGPTVSILLPALRTHPDEENENIRLQSLSLLFLENSSFIFCYFIIILNIFYIFFIFYIFYIYYIFYIFYIFYIYYIFYIFYIYSIFYTFYIYYIYYIFIFFYDYCNKIIDEYIEKRNS